MYDTFVTVVGNVLNPPEWRRTTTTRTLVTTFKIASTARRLDRETGRWVDGNSLRVRVSCWRALASNVASSVTVGDPLVVTGRLYTRDWTDEAGTRRVQYELEATAVGHDLTRGRSRFERVRPSTSTSVVEDRQAQQRAGGEETEPVPAEHAPTRFDDTPYDVPEEPVETPVTPVLRGTADRPGADGRGADDPGADGPDDSEPVGHPADLDGSADTGSGDTGSGLEPDGDSGNGRLRTPVPA